ncbi:MAG: hypothetical protein AAGF97_00800 [Planctomycetota bacterium]
MCAAEDGLIQNLHCFLQARPKEAVEIPLQVGTTTVQALRVPTAQPPLPLEIGFEELLEQLQANPNCHTEPDGWFAWTGYAGEIFWSLSGQLTDDGQRMRLVELKGDCPPATLATLQEMLSPQQQPLMIQLPQVGLFFDAHHFTTYRQAIAQAS